MPWRLEIHTATMIQGHPHFGRLRQMGVTGSLAVHGLTVLCVVIVLIGQFVSATLALVAALSLTWTLGLRHMPFVFAMTSTMLFMVAVGCTVMLWRVAIVKLKSKMIDVESMTMAVGFALSFAVAIGWLLLA